MKPNKLLKQLVGKVINFKKGFFFLNGVELGLCINCSLVLEFAYFRKLKYTVHYIQLLNLLTFCSAKYFLINQRQPQIPILNYVCIEIHCFELLGRKPCQSKNPEIHEDIAMDEGKCVFYSTNKQVLYMIF